MNSLLFVCFLSCASATACNAQQQEMRPGVSVQMAVANSAPAVPDADDSDAWIVTVTADGSLFFGTDRMTREELGNWMISHPRKRGQKLYVKADARTQYADVLNVLEAIRSIGVDAPTLLTTQLDSPQPGIVLPPKGLEVLVGPTLPAGVVATVVQLLDSGQQGHTLKINNDPISWPALQSTLEEHFRKGDERVILLKAEARLQFADVVDLIDTCHAAGAKVVLE